MSNFDSGNGKGEFELAAFESFARSLALPRLDLHQKPRHMFR